MLKAEEKSTSGLKELIMCYSVPADAGEDCIQSSSPHKDLDAIKAYSAIPESGVAAMKHKLLAPFSKENGGTWRIDDIETEISDDKLEVDKVS